MLDGKEKEWLYDEDRKTSCGMKADPLPDFLEGRVLCKESVHLTEEIRKRMPFLSHIPLFTDIVFVELDLYNILSEETRRKFKNEFAKRRKKRQSKVQAEKRADHLAQKKDQDIIKARKARLQTVDPDDEFFHAMVAVSERDPEPAVENTNVGPILAGESLSSSNAITRDATQNTEESSRFSSLSNISFSQVAQRERAIEAFPSLSSSEASWPLSVTFTSMTS